MMFKKISLLLLLLGFSTAALSRGYYIGLQLGESIIPTENATATVNNNTISYQSHTRRGFSGRFLYGYRVDPAFAIELGFAQYAKDTWHVTVNGAPASDASFSAHDLDWMLRFDWRVATSPVHLYTKLGLALLRARYTENTSAFDLNQHAYFLRPEAALGASYRFNRHWSMDLMWDHVFGKGSLRNALIHQSADWHLPSLNLLTLGVTYSF